MKETKKVKMTKEQIEKKKKRIIKTFITILVILVVAIIGYKANDYIILDKNKTINLIFKSYFKSRGVVQASSFSIFCIFNLVAKFFP